MLCFPQLTVNKTCTHCSCQPCTQGEHIVCIVVLFLLLVLLVILLDNVIVVVNTTYVPFFYIALGDIIREGLMSEEEVGELRKIWRGCSWVTALNPICAILCTKELSGMMRTAKILQKCGLTRREEVKFLKGYLFYTIYFECP